MSNNTDLKRLVRSMKDQEAQAQSHDDILNVVNMAIDYDGELKYQHGLSYTGLIAGLLLLIGCGLYFYDSYRVPEYFYALVVTIFVVTACFGWGIYSKENDISKLSRSLFEKDMMLDNNIENIDLDSHKAGELQNTYSEFKRGNYLREFKRFWRINESEHSESALYYHFHYVDQQTQIVTESDGKGGSRTRTDITYHHYDRYGLVFDFKYGAGLSINSSGETRNPVHYKPSYGKFNSVFSIGANSEQDAAKYLKPALVEKVVTLASRFEFLNIQISNDGQMLIAFSDAMLNETEQQYDLKEPEKFHHELKQRTVIAYFGDCDRSFRFIPIT
ncbi:DUF3137 domain-containing protein [Vibrio coralliilyticus]|uniref:DUF3137 domain-containing protein n=1 Tax=Vibrio coralliilyticus TaxID=190893 RepID=UPI00148BA23C|nr:DUF3137 domain-containing protein [Vibrio coralliilyticus]NOI32043.1 hypothetical protein [Vibrio coralliilyticus]